MKRNLKNHLRGSNSNMGLTTRRLQKTKNFLAKTELPHFFEVKFVNHPNKLEKVHCGTLKDVERILDMYPDAMVTQVFPPLPTTVDVPCIRIKDQELPMQQILPESDLQPINLK